LGHAFAQLVLQERAGNNKSHDGGGGADEETVTTIAIGRDPRQHGNCLCDAFGRGAQMASPNVRVVYTGIASTPSMYHFCRYVYNLAFCGGSIQYSVMHFHNLHEIIISYLRVSAVRGCAMVLPWSQLHIYRATEMALNYSPQQTVDLPKPKSSK
jgi:hypothetical protein